MILMLQLIYDHSSPKYSGRIFARLNFLALSMFASSAHSTCLGCSVTFMTVLIGKESWLGLLSSCTRKKKDNNDKTDCFKIVKVVKDKHRQEKNST